MASSESFVFSVENPATLHLCFIVCEPTVFDAATGIHTGVKVITKFTRGGLIDLLVAVAAQTSLGTWWAGVLARIGFIVAPRTSL